MKILRTDEVVALRKTMSAAQNYTCPVCGSRLVQGDAALDHCHKTGHVRSVLCRSCNTSEGKVIAAMLYMTRKTNMAYRNPSEWLRSLADYWDNHQNNPSGMIHPSFNIKTGKQKVVRRRKRT